MAHFIPVTLGMAPDRYFLLVVGLYACLEEERHLLVAHVSERIIVRVSET